MNWAHTEVGLVENMSQKWVLTMGNINWGWRDWIGKVWS